MSALHAPIYRWTVEKYEELGRAGFIAEDERVELLNGEIIAMSPIRIRHATAVRLLTNVLARKSRARYEVDPQNPFNLDPHSQPQPDLTLVNPVVSKQHRHPTVDDLFLVIEVSDSTLRYDRKDKCPAYAAQGIREFWLLNLNADVLEVYRNPVGGIYQDTQVLGPKETIAPLAFPDLKLRIGNFLV